jgi:two-component system sensor kinase FixL
MKPKKNQEGAAFLSSENRTYSLLTNLIFLVVMALLPAIVFVVISAKNSADFYTKNYEHNLQSTARSIGRAVDSDLEVHLATLNQLALSSDIGSWSNSGRFRRQAAEAAAPLLSRITFTDTSGHQVFDTSIAEEEAIPQYPADSGVTEPMTTATATVTNVFSSSASRFASAVLSVLVVRDDSAAGVLDIAIDAYRLSRTLSAGSYGSGGATFILDGNGRVVARSNERAELPGDILKSVLETSRVQGVRENSDQGRAYDKAGLPVIFSTSPLTLAPRWRLVVTEPAVEYDNARKTHLTFIAFGGLSSLVLGVMMASFLGRRVLRPVRELSMRAQDLFSGDNLGEFGLSPARITEFLALQRSLLNAGSMLRLQAKAEKDAVADAQRGSALLKSVIEGTPDAIFAKDTDRNFILVNAATSAALGGHDVNAIIGRSVDHFLSPEMARGIKATDLEVMTSGISSVTEEVFPGPEKDRIYLTTRSPWYGERGEIIGLVGVARDITERRHAEARIRQVQSELLRATRSNAMGAVAAGLAHELNQPLAATVNFLSAAQRLFRRAEKTEGDVEAKQLRDAGRGALSDASFQSLRAGRIVRRLRDYVSLGDTEMHEEAIGPLIDDTCAAVLSGKIGESMTLNIDVSPDAGMILVDRVQVQQVLANLIRNAAEAMAASSSKILTIKAVKTKDSGVEVSVSDTGAGLSKEASERLFLPFASTKQSGMGIGLTICRTIVESHGGRIWHTAQPEGGTVFAFSLPPAKLIEDEVDE